MELYSNHGLCSLSDISLHRVNTCLFLLFQQVYIGGFAKEKELATGSYIILCAPSGHWQHSW